MSVLRVIEALLLGHRQQIAEIRPRKAPSKGRGVDERNNFHTQKNDTKLPDKCINIWLPAATSQPRRVFYEGQ